MSKFMRMKSFIMVLSIVGATFASCSSSDDNDGSIPNQIVAVEDVVGAYSGKAITTQGELKNELLVNFEANDSLIVFADMPVKELVASVIKDDSKVDETLAKMEKVAYDLDFTAALSESKTAVELTFEPKELEVTVPVEEGSKEVKAVVVAKQKGIYTSNYVNSLQFEIIIEKITVDGVEEADFKEIKYSFPAAVKK